MTFYVLIVALLCMLNFNFKDTHVEAVDEIPRVGLRPLLELNTTGIWKRHGGHQEVYAVISNEKGVLERREIHPQDVNKWCLYKPIAPKDEIEYMNTVKLGLPINDMYPGFDYDNFTLADLSKRSRHLIAGSYKFPFSKENMVILKYDNHKILCIWRKKNDARKDPFVYVWLKCIPKENSINNDYNNQKCDFGKSIRNPIIIERKDHRHMAVGDSHKLAYGEDMRVLMLENGTLMSNWCIATGEGRGRRRGIQDTITMHFSELKLEGEHTVFDPNKGLLEVHTDHISPKISVGIPITRIDLTNENHRNFEKNWPVFQYKSNIFYIVSIHPFRVISVLPATANVLNSKQKPHSILKRSFGHSVSFSASVEFCFPWGTLRGGTPAKLVDGEYLGFFHAKSHFGNRFVATYIFGVYTFTGEPPFRLTSISRYPIAVEEFMALHWTFAHEDVNHFPIAFEFDKEADRIYVSMGVNDRKGYVVEIIYSELKASLRPIHSVVLAKCDWANGVPLLDTYEFEESASNFTFVNQ